MTIIVNPDEVTPETVLGTLILDACNTAAALEHEYGSFLKPPPVGIYKLGDSKPILTPKTEAYKYIKETNTLVRLDYADLPLHNDTVYDKIGLVLVSSYLMRNKSLLLSTGPTIPVAGMRLIVDYFHLIIHNNLRWCNRTGYYEEYLYRNNFLEEKFFEVDLSNILTTVKDLVRESDAFIDFDYWNYYTVTSNNTDLVINKCADYRICEWYKQNAIRDDESE